MIAPEVLELLRCPLTGSRLKLASAELIESVNELIDDGQVLTRIQVAVSEPLDAGLVNDDDSLLVQVRKDVPTLISDELIDLQQLDLASTSPAPTSEPNAEDHQGESGDDDFQEDNRP